MNQNLYTPILSFVTNTVLVRSLFVIAISKNCFKRHLIKYFSDLELQTELQTRYWYIK